MAKNIFGNPIVPANVRMDVMSAQVLALYIRPYNFPDIRYPPVDFATVLTWLVDDLHLGL